MATAGSQSDEDTTSEEEDFDQYIDDDWFVAKKLQQLEDDLPSIDDQPGTASRHKEKSLGASCIASSESAATSTPATPFDGTILQRTPKIKSTRLSVKFVRDLLMSKHGVEKEAAQAAVLSRGCDIELCLHWIERNSFNFTLLEEKSKEFEFKCGLITETDMMDWTVRHLTTRHGVVEELAKATVLIKGCEHFGECRKLAMNPDDEIRSILDGNKEYQKKIEKDLLEAYGVEEKFASAWVRLKEFDSFFEWDIQNQYDEEKQNKLVTILQSDPSMDQDLLRTLAVTVGQEFVQVASKMYMALFPQNFEAVMSEQHRRSVRQTMRGSLLHSFRDSRNRCYLEELQRKFSSTENHAVAHATVFVLSDFMSEMMAKAAVQASGKKLDHCQEWAKKNVNNQGTIQRMASQFDGNHKFIACHIMVKFIARKIRLAYPDHDLVLWYRMCQRIVEASLEATSSTNFNLCLKWIENRKAQALKEKMMVDELSDVKNRNRKMKKIVRAIFDKRRGTDRDIGLFGASKPPDERTVYKIMAMAAIQATSSTVLSACKTWLSKNASNVDEIMDLWQQFKRNRVMYLRELHVLDPRTLTHWDYVLLNTREFLKKSALKAEKKQKIGPGGGEISLQKCSVIFPEGALKEEKDFRMSLNNDPKQFPSFSIPITSILSCRPSMDFEKPVTVRMQTCYSAIGDAEITASLYQRKDEKAIWAEVQKVTLTNRNGVQFDVMHFSDDVVGVSEGTQGEFHLINDVYIKKDTSTIASIFFVDQGAHDLATADMQSRGVVPILMKAKKIIAKMGTEIKITLECSRPVGMVATNYNDPLLKVTPEFIKRREHEIYFELDQIPQDYNGKLLIKYTLKIGEVEETLPLTTSWPIVIPEKPVLQIGNVSIDSRTSIRGNIVSAGDARTSIESHDPVYHIGDE